MRRLTRRQRISAIVLAVVALCFITLDLGGGSLRDAHAGVRGTLGSLYRGTDAVLGPVRRWVQGVPTAGTQHRHASTRCGSENAALRGAARRAARPTTRTAAQLAPAAARRRRQRQPAAAGPGDRVRARVRASTGRSPSTPAPHDGVRVGQTVTDGAGLVGRVLHADARLAASCCSPPIPARASACATPAPARSAWPPARGRTGSRFAPLDPDARGQGRRPARHRPDRASSYVAGLPVGTVTRCARRPTARCAPRCGRPRHPTAVDLVGVIVGRRTGLADRAARASRRAAMTRARVAAALAGILTALLLQATLVAPVTRRGRSACPPCWSPRSRSSTGRPPACRSASPPGWSPTSARTTRPACSRCAGWASACSAARSPTGAALRRDAVVAGVVCGAGAAASPTAAARVVHSGAAAVATRSRYALPTALGDAVLALARASPLVRRHAAHRLAARAAPGLHRTRRRRAPWLSAPAAAPRRRRRAGSASSSRSWCR